MNIKNIFQSDLEHENIVIFILFLKNLFLYPSHPHFHSYQMNMLSTLNKGHFTLQTLESLLNSYKLEPSLKNKQTKKKHSHSKYTHTPDETG